MKIHESEAEFKRIVATAKAQGERFKSDTQIKLRQLQDARNLWNVAPEDSHESWIQQMQECINRSCPSKRHQRANL